MMARPRPCLASWRGIRDRVGPVLALVTLLAFATGGAGLAHRVLAHADGGQTDAADQHAHAHGGSACGSVPLSNPDTPEENHKDDDTAHGCDVCTLLATGATLPATCDAVPTPHPTADRAFCPATRAPRIAAAPLPPARGPPTVSA